MVALPEANTGLPAEGLVAALRAQLAELGVQVVVSSEPFDARETNSPERSAKEDNALAFVWLGKEGANLSVHFFESAGATLRQRRLPLRGTDAASLEEVAVVVRSAVSSLLDRDTSLRQDTPPQQAEPRPKNPPPAPLTESGHKSARGPKPAPADEVPLGLFWASLGFTGQAFAPELPFSPGAAALLGVRPTHGPWGLGVGYAFFPRQTAVRGPVSVELSRHPLEMILRFESSPQTNSYVGAEAGLVVDWVTRRSASTSAEFAVTPEATRVSWAVTGRALLGMRLSKALSLEVHGGADWLGSRVSTELSDGARLVEPHRIRPRISVQAVWNFP